MPEVLKPNPKLNTAPEKHAGGRPTKLTAKLIKEISKTVEAGNYIEVACNAAGIKSKTWGDWLHKGTNLEDKDPKTLDKNGRLLVKFSLTVKTALAKGLVSRVGAISKAGEKSWQANAWILERTNPALYAQRVVTEGKQEITITIVDKVLDPVKEIGGPVTDLLPGTGYEDVDDG